MKLFLREWSLFLGLGIRSFIRGYLAGALLLIILSPLLAFRSARLRPDHARKYKSPFVYDIY